MIEQFWFECASTTPPLSNLMSTDRDWHRYNEALVRGALDLDSPVVEEGTEEGRRR